MLSGFIFIMVINLLFFTNLSFAMVNDEENSEERRQRYIPIKKNTAQREENNENGLSNVPNLALPSLIEPDAPKDSEKKSPTRIDPTTQTGSPPKLSKTLPVGKRMNSTSHSSKIISSKSFSAIAETSTGEEIPSFKIIQSTPLSINPRRIPSPEKLEDMLPMKTNMLNPSPINVKNKEMRSSPLKLSPGEVEAGSPEVSPKVNPRRTSSEGHKGQKIENTQNFSFKPGELKTLFLKKLSESLTSGDFSRISQEDSAKQYISPEHQQIERKETILEADENLVSQEESQDSSEEKK